MHRMPFGYMSFTVATELITSHLLLLTQQGEPAHDQVTSAEDEIKQKKNGPAEREDALSSS